ncbi:subunit of tubulin prefoldin [Blyttiomyces sp. JEL0837]|nr:subunit of tubulin prefoldin [Blyttiomyces sp. JEL0837]
MEGNGPINLSDLPLPQLKAVREQMEEELQHLTGSYAHLKQAQVKFNDSTESLQAICGKADGEIMIPLTNSLYVPGKLADVDHVIVDVGTGYMMEKTIDEAKEFYKGKVTYLREKLEQLQETITMREQQYRGELCYLHFHFDVTKPNN